MGQNSGNSSAAANGSGPMARAAPGGQRGGSGTALPAAAGKRRSPRPPGTSRRSRHENRDIPAQARISRKTLYLKGHSGKLRPHRHGIGHIFLESEEIDTSSTGRSSDSGSSRRAPSRLPPMAHRAPLTLTAAVLSGTCTPFPFDPAFAGTCEFPDIQLSTSLSYHTCPVL